MPFRVPPSRIAQALDYLGRLRDRAGGILNTVASTPGTLRPDEYQERFGLPGDPVPAPREVGRTVRGAATRFTSLDAPQSPTFAEMAAETGASFVPGVGQLLAARDIERARRADDPAGMAMAASNFLPVDRLIGALRHGLGRPPISELDVYHGTPHTYAPTEANPLGEFDASKIGAGEGAQAYGHGIYLAESPSVAKSYRLAGSDAQHRRLTGGMTPMEEAAFDLASQGTKGEDLFSAMYQRYGKNLQTDQDLDAFQAAIRNAESSSGNLLKADLPDEMIDRMLDWDKPLSEQPAAVQKAIRESFGDFEPNDSGKFIHDQLISELRLAEGNPTGRRLEFPYSTTESLARERQYPVLIAEKLKQAGIPGIRYLDAGSRGQGGSGTRNFVVFPGEEKKVRILERNGQPAPERIAQALEAAPNYRMAHRPMTVEGGAARLDNAYEAFGEDIYGPNALRYFGGSDPREAGTVAALKRLRDNPEAEVTIYRGVPADAKGGITKGDWVTLDRSAAQEYAELKPGQKGKVLAMKVKAKDVTTWPDSLLEFGYYPAE